MSESGNSTVLLLAAEQVVRSVYEAFISCDAARIERTARESFAEDITVHEAESLPWGGRYEGIDTVVAMTVALADPLAPIDAANLSIDEIFVREASGGVAHVVAAVSFPFRGQTTIPMRALEWFTVEDGLVVDIRVFLWDTAAAIAALGAPPQG